MNQLFTCWSFDWSSAALLLILAAWVLFMGSMKKAGTILALIILFVLCFVSPLYILSSGYLFSAHMTVHVLLLLCMGPLLVRVLPPDTRRLSHLFTLLKQYPVLCWLTGLGMMWLWHVPILFNYGMTAMHHGQAGLAITESLSLIAAGVLFSAPVLHPDKRYRIDPPAGVVYLFTACVGCSLLGLLITFAPAGIYHHFLSMHDPYALNKIILNQWNITRSTDQQAAGLIMWVPCCLIYVTGAIYLLAKWFKKTEKIIPG